jgi:hypothetical protein
MQNLTPDEVKLVANLAQDRGFIILLTALQADMDDLSDSIHSAATDEEERRAVSRWRAYRDLISALQSIPAWASNRLTTISEEVPPQFVQEDIALTTAEQQSAYDIMSGRDDVTNQNPFDVLK